MSTREGLLIEDDHPALEISDFAAFRDAGFDAAFCSGPPGGCPLLGGADCEVLAGADVVLHGLDAGLADAIRWWHPEVPVVVKGGPGIPADCSVKGQVRAVRQTLQDAARDEGTGYGGTGYGGTGTAPVRSSWVRS